MFDRLKTALNRAAAPEPVRAAAPVPSSHALVPVHRARHEVDRPADQMGYLDRHHDSARPGLTPAPYLRTADQEIRTAWGPVSAHARHLVTQSGFLQYGVELMAAWTCGGDGLRPNITPDFMELGWSESFSKTWARAVEQSFYEWSNDARACDARGLHRWGAMQNAAIKGWFSTGDILGVLDYGVKGGTEWRSAISLIDPARLWTPPFHQYGVRTFDGIEMTESGRPTAYHIRPIANGVGKTIRVPAFNDSGKQLVFHGFDGDVGTIRGISVLGSAIAGIVQSQNVADAAILASHVAAMVVGVVTSDLPSDAVAKSFGAGDADPLSRMMESRVSWHEGLKKNGAHLTLGHGARIAHLSTGERFDLLAGKITFSEYEKIIRLGLAEAARAIGISPEALHGIKDQATYSSLKVAAVEARAVVARRRKILLEPLNDWALNHVVEEMIASGRLPFRSRLRLPPLEAYRALKSKALRVSWTGPSIEDPDELKAARAAVLRLQYGLSSHTDEIASRGADAEDVFDKRKADREMLRERQLFVPWPDNPGRPPQKTTSSKEKK